MSHKNEYYENMVTMLELIWGEGYMAPGGTGNIAKLLDGTRPAGKRILDIGCGIGGPVFEMLQTHGAQVIGIDLEQPLINRANADAKKYGLNEHCQFMTVTPGRLPFADASFDIVTSSGAITQTPDKGALFAEILRVLSPGGTLSCYEWMRGTSDYSDNMKYWFELEGLTYALLTLDNYADQFRDAGFDGISRIDASDWYTKESRREYDLIKGDLYARMVELLGQEDADHFVENWRLLAIVCESGELRQGYVRGQKPATTASADELTN